MTTSHTITPDQAPNQAPDQAPNHARGYAIAISAAAILSTTAVFIRHLSLAYQIPALVLAFWRDVFTVLTLAAVFAGFRRDLLRVPRTLLPGLILYGFVLAIFNALGTLSVVLNGAAAATVLVYCSGAFTVVLGRIILHEPLSLAKFGAIALSLGGCVLVANAFDASAWHTQISGILTGILSGLSYAVYSLLGRSASKRGLNPWTTLLYIFGFATCFIFLFNLPPGGPLPGSAKKLADLFWLRYSVTGWGILFLLAAGPTVAGFGLYLVSLVHLPSSVANLVVSLEPAFTALIAYLCLGERLGGFQLLGGLMILAGVLVLRISEGSPQTTANRT